MINPASEPQLAAGPPTTCPSIAAAQPPILPAAWVHLEREAGNGQQRALGQDDYINYPPCIHCSRAGGGQDEVGEQEQAARAAAAVAAQRRRRRRRQRRPRGGGDPAPRRTLLHIINPLTHAESVRKTCTASNRFASCPPMFQRNRVISITRGVCRSGDWRHPRPGLLRVMGGGGGSAQHSGFAVFSMLGNPFLTTRSVAFHTMICSGSSHLTAQRGRAGGGDGLRQHTSLQA